MSNYFDNWKAKEIHKNQLFIFDGVIDEQAWEQSKFKTLFLLKEAYRSKNETNTWDLTNHIRNKGVSGRTFKPMAQWAYGIKNVFLNGKISTYKPDGEEVKKALLSSSIINIKKSAGTKRSGAKNLKKYAKEDWNQISEQIISINPKIIICGNTWSLIKDQLTEKTKISDRAYLSKGVIYIDFWHPSNRASNLMNYYALCAIVDIALKADSALL